jgi:hypothetical protein
VKRTISGTVRWAAQLMLEGAPHQKAKNVISDSESALDIGPSTVAGVGDTDAFLTQFCDVSDPAMEKDQVRTAGLRIEACVPPILATTIPTGA